MSKVVDQRRNSEPAPLNLEMWRNCKTPGPNLGVGLLIEKGGLSGPSLFGMNCVLTNALRGDENEGEGGKLSLAFSRFNQDNGTRGRFV